MFCHSSGHAGSTLIPSFQERRDKRERKAGRGRLYVQRRKEKHNCYDPSVVAPLGIVLARIYSPCLAMP